MTTTTIETVAGPMVIDEEELRIGRFLDEHGNIPTHDEIVAFMRRHVAEGDSATDVGANAGFFTLVLADIVGPTGHVTSFEPNTPILRNLDQSISDRGLGHVFTVNTGVGTRRYWATLRYDPRGPGGTQVIEETEREGYIIVQPLDEQILVRRPVSFIKIDTEGMDVDVLLGAEDILAKDRPVILFEWNPEAQLSLGKPPRSDVQKILDLCEKHSYVLCDYRTEEQVDPWGVDLSTDYALIPSEKVGA